jgi:serine/threonine protein kinase
VETPDPAYDGSAFEDFTLVRELGRGASSVVHLAWQHSLDRDVALKRLRRSLSADASSTERLRREAQVVSRLDHPRIIRLYDLITDGADLVLVMESVLGPSVQSMAARARPSASQALAIVSDVAEALDYAASRGVVHRDIKPANVFITAAGRCKLGDFGLARISGERAMFLSNDGTVRGTPLYMAPEQLRGDAPTSAWDVYALALMATELLSGRHPFAGMSVRGAVEAHLDGGAASAAAGSALPAPVLAVLCSGLASSAADRPTARHLADRLVDAAPIAWFGETADRAPLVASSPAAPGTYAEDADGLWAGGRQAGWTVELVDDSTWHGSSEAARDRSTLVESSPDSHTSPGSPAIPRSPVSKASTATINDKWIRQATPRVGPSSARRRTGTRLSLGSWAIYIAAFVVGFGIVLALLLLRTH